MGARQSSVDKMSLAEKRYRINSPKKCRRRSQNRDPSVKLKNTTSMSLDRTTSIDENLKVKVVVHSNSMSQVPYSNGPVSQTSVDSLTPVQTPTTMSPFFADQQEIVNKQQQKLIESSWKRSRKLGPENVGSKVFLLVLIAEPEIKMIFGLDKIPQGRLKYDPRFRKHTGLISKSLEHAVKNIEFAEKLAQNFQSLGKKHVSMQGRGFKSTYWQTFSDVMLQTTNEWLNAGHKTEETIAAWRILISFIIRHMQIGFEREKLMRKRYAPTVNANINSTAIKVPSINQKNKLSIQRQQTGDFLSPPAMSGRSNNERSASWVGADPTFDEDFSRLRLTASQRHPRNHVTIRQATAPEMERPESPSSDYFTPPSSRRQLSTDTNTLEKRLLNAQNRGYYVNA